jgi:hypothetical protein
MQGEGGVVPSRSSAPSFSNDEVVCVGERNRVSVRFGSEVYISTGFIILGIILTSHESANISKIEVGSTILEISGEERSRLCRSSQRPSNCRKSNSEVKESNHDCGDELMLIKLRSRQYHGTGRLFYSHITMMDLTPQSIIDDPIGGKTLSSLSPATEPEVALKLRR